MTSQSIDQLISRGIGLQSAGQLAEAEHLYREALRAQPNNPFALHYLGLIAHQIGRHDVAVDLIGRSISLHPSAPGFFYNNFGEALRMIGRNDDAVRAYQKSIELEPDNLESLNNLTIALRLLGRAGEAIKIGRRVVELKPDWAIGHNNLANALGDFRQNDEAIREYELALEIDPNYAEAASNMAATYQENYQFSAAIKAFRRTLEIDPNHAVAWDGLATSLTERRKYRDSTEARRRSLALTPSFAAAHSNLLLSLNYSEDHTPEEIFAEHVAWARQLADPLSENTIRRAAGNDDPDRQIRIGYVSPDFCGHSVVYFIEPVLANHDRSKFHITCYSDVKVADERTQRVQKLPDQWRHITGLSDDQVAAIVRQDGIDILVDLAGHTSSGRLLTFARCPAPVQISYLGYPNTSGTKAIQYRLTDALADPPGMTESLFVEKLIRLPKTFLCYQPSDQMEVAPLPCVSSGHVTFGSFNKLAKVNPNVVAMWSKILQTVEGSRMIIKAPGVHEPNAAKDLLDDFATNGIGAERIELIGRRLPYGEHLATYGRVDIALDTYPYHGTTTTCDALWMGVPVVTLAGRTHASRVGVSLLTNIGLSELVTNSIDDFVATARKLVNDRDRLTNLRSTLRQKMKDSPVLRAEEFTKDFEAALREIWHENCR